MVSLIQPRMQKWAKDVLPPVFHRALVHAHGSLYNLKHREKLAQNQFLRHKHEGQRCFILGNSPSVLDNDLGLLGGESVFTISNGYLHPNYDRISPKYHCVPQLTYSDVEGGMSELKAVEWFSEMDDSLGEAEIFLHLNEYVLVKKKGLFSKRRVWFVGSHPAWQRRPSCDLTKALFPILSAPQMVIAIAIYMGFKSIYLLGIDYNFVCTRKYNYFFNGNMLKFNDPGVKDDGTLRTTLVQDLEGTWRIFLGFERLSKLASRGSVNIYNCSEHSMLDAFPKIDLRKVLKENEGLLGGGGE